MSNRCFNFTVTEKLFFKNLRGTRGPLHSGAPGLCPPCPPHCCATGLGIAVSSPSGFGRSPATKRIYVHFEVKLKHSSCQSAATSEIVKCSWACVHRGAALYQVPDLYLYLYLYTHLSARQPVFLQWSAVVRAVDGRRQPSGGWSCVSRSTTARSTSLLYDASAAVN